MKGIGEDDPRPDEPAFRCTWAEVGVRAAEVQVAGELDLATGPVLADALRAAGAAAPLVLIRMEHVSFVDVVALRVLHDAVVRAREERRKVVVAHPRPKLAALLDLLELHGEFDFTAEQDAAVSDVEHLAALERPSNPTNAAILAARIMAVPDRRVWLQAEDGAIRCAWAPPQAHRAASAGRPAEIFLDRNGAVNGWCDVVSGLAVDQRRLDPECFSQATEPMVCQGACGRTWQAPAADELAKHQDRCLTCAGPLARG